MLFEDIIKELNDIDINNKEKIKILINYINIDDNNFNNWVENIFIFSLLFISISFNSFIISSKSIYITPFLIHL